MRPPHMRTLTLTLRPKHTLAPPPARRTLTSGRRPTQTPSQGPQSRGIAAQLAHRIRARLRAHGAALAGGGRLGGRAGAPERAYPGAGRRRGACAWTLAGRRQGPRGPAGGGTGRA